MSAALPSWNDGAAKTAILGFADRVTEEGGADYVPPADRIAVYDNDGTLWCEKPMPIELGFILRRFSEMAEQDAALRGRQPWKAAREHDYAWLAGAITKHYAGDESDMQVLMAAILQAFAGQSVEEYSAAATAFLLETAHPTLGRTFDTCGYVPMVELMRYLEERGFTNYIASGGDRDFMRPVTEAMYGVPPERVIGSSNGLSWIDDDDGGRVTYTARPDVFDDGPVKPARIWSRVGRRPILAAGNSNGDVPMLRYAGGNGHPALRLLVQHDDEDREFAYTAGSEQALAVAHDRGWDVVSIKDDWASVFPA